MLTQKINIPDSIEIFEKFLEFDDAKKVAQYFVLDDKTIYRHINKLKKKHDARSYYHLMYILHFKKLIDVDEIFDARKFK